ncbi:electron transfer flavoprotein subunit beta/FixA family protein [Pseudactinotalea suaedae]|uniref:electron transfer flavoprotein subunit beta/FixA family protein n=1 Tax=Pseudactinotalea suaedae TaxID=1524924 RepID=UPI0012E1D053|nr:electron transfer flavoprotein subunit beta/FixA family protein [Pseudactinotalea suaedae]
MRVVVLVKHVPELLSQRALGEDGRTVRTSDDSALNEVDENAVEAALQLAGSSEGEVIAVTLGPSIAVDALRRTLAMGASRAVHATGDAFAGGDVVATARALAAAVRHLDGEAPVDVVLTGLAALDGLGSVIPSLVAAELGWPQLTVVEELTLEGQTLVGRRELDGATERWRAATPAVVSVTDSANDPRLPKMKDLLAARAAEITVLTHTDLGLADEEVGAAGSRTRVVEAAQRPEHPGPEIVTDDDGEGGVLLARYLLDNDLVGGAR